MIGPMDETTYRVLDSLSRDFGSAISINSLTGKIKKLHKTAYYKNTYDKVHELEKLGIIRPVRAGRSSAITLNFGNYILINLLSEMELRKERGILMKNARLQTLLFEIEARFKQFNFLSSASMLSPEKTLPMNRLELLLIFKPQPSEPEIQKEMSEAYAVMREFQDKTSTRMDFLFLKENELSGFLKDENFNPLGEMLSDKIAFLYPQNFWSSIAESARTGIATKPPELINIWKISEQDLAYNMDRFGYREMGTEIGEGRKICLECILASLLASGNARRTEAIPVMLAKGRPNYNLLVFLSRKSNSEGKLLGMIKSLNRIRKSEEAECAIKRLEALKIKEEKADEKAIRKKMRLYNAD